MDRDIEIHPFGFAGQLIDARNWKASGITAILALSLAAYYGAL